MGHGTTLALKERARQKPLLHRISARGSIFSPKEDQATTPLVALGGITGLSGRCFAFIVHYLPGELGVGSERLLSRQ